MKGAILVLAAFTLFAALSMPSEVSAQGRGRGWGKDKWGKKCDKFVNCHDARDGRWDNRGPRRRVILGNRVYDPFYRSRVYSPYRWRRAHRMDRIYIRGLHGRRRG
jgi:hypothetical protein